MSALVSHSMVSSDSRIIVIAPLPCVPGHRLCLWKAACRPAHTRLNFARRRIDHARIAEPGPPRRLVVLGIGVSGGGQRGCWVVQSERVAGSVASTKESVIGAICASGIVRVEIGEEMELR